MHLLMQEHCVRYLPVVDGGDLCEIVSDRDIRVLESAGRVDSDTITVVDTMTERPFVVTGDTALEEVVEIMGEHRYGSVVIEGHDGVEGISTAVDACRVLAKLLRRATA
jgi:acetoin utilization protein AcuB